MSSKPLVWKAGLRSTTAKPRAANIAAEDWQSHQDVIRQEYMVKDLPLKRVAEYMRRQHGFFATERQYTSQFEKWGWIKRSSHRRQQSCMHLSQNTTDVNMEEISPPQGPIEFSQDGSTFETIDLESEETRIIEGSKDTQACDIMNITQPNLPIQSAAEPPRYSSIFGPRLVTQDLPIPTNNDEQTFPSLITPEGCENEGGILNLPGTDDDSPTMSATSYTELSNLMSPTIYNPPSQVSMRLLTTRGRCDGTVLLNSIKPKTAKTLEKLLRRDHTRIRSDQVTYDDLLELFRTSDFLFAAQSYEDSFTLSRITGLLVEKYLESRCPCSEIGESPAWLIAAVYITRSATTAKDAKHVVRVLKSIRSRSDFGMTKESKDYSLLQAFLGDTLHELSDHKDSYKAAVACWIKLLAQPLDSKYPLSRRIMSSKLQEIMSNASTPNLPKSMYLKLDTKLKEEDGRVGIWVKDGVLSANAIVVLHWCVESLGHDEFYFMISNIDETFWTAHRHDVEIYERLVVYCYLCERLWRLEHLQRTDLLHDGGQVLNALNSMQSKTGLSNVAILYSIVNVCRHVITSMTEIPTRLTLPVRYMTCMEAFHEKCRTTGFEDTSGYFTMSVDNLINHSGWPGKITSLQDQLHDREYAWSVRVFLREFISVNLELDLTKRLHQAEDGFREGRASTDSVPLVPTARSSQMSEDYATFKAAAKRVSYEDRMSLQNSNQPPSAGLDDLALDASNQFRLFRYSGSLRGSTTIDEEVQTDPTQYSDNQESSCGNESRLCFGDLNGNPTSALEEGDDHAGLDLVSGIIRMSF